MCAATPSGALTVTYAANSAIQTVMVTLSDANDEPDATDVSSTVFTNGQFEHLIDGEKAAAAFNCTIQVYQGGVST